MGMAVAERHRAAFKSIAPGESCLELPPHRSDRPLLSDQSPIDRSAGGDVPAWRCPAEDAAYLRYTCSFTMIPGMFYNGGPGRTRAKESSKPLRTERENIVSPPSLSLPIKTDAVSYY